MNRNTKFPPGQHEKIYTQIAIKGDLRIQDCLAKNDLKRKLGYFHNLQIASYQRKLGLSEIQDTTLSKIAQAFLEARNKNISIRESVTLLGDMPNEIKYPFAHKWEMDLYGEHSKVPGPERKIDWGKALQAAHLPTHSSLKLTNYFLITRAYVASDRNKNMPKVICKWCKVEEASSLHKWFNCLTIGPFWQRVIRECTTRTGMTLQTNPETALFSWSEEVISAATVKKMKAVTMLSVARFTIAKSWQSDTPPNIENWEKNVNSYLNTLE